jgi:N-acetylglucosamine-6-phosphate deacetylase
MSANGTACVITGATVFDGDDFLEGHCVVLEGATITHVLPAAEAPAAVATCTLSGGVLAPGFIDLQVNGGGGVMLNNEPTSDAVLRIAAAHRACGTTSLLPTVMSDTPERQRACVDAVRAALDSGHPGIAGIHIEGPFFEPARRGAHNANLIRSLESADVEWLGALDDLKVLLTLAPEHASPAQLEQIAGGGTIISAGHTNATYDQIKAAADHGLSGVTHLYNAMSPSTGRQPGTVGAALDDDRLWVSVIADGHHVHPANIRTAYRAKPGGMLLLVSDAMATVGGSVNTFELYDHQVTECDGRLINSEGVLAGSAIGLIDAVRFAHEVVGLPLAECLRMASRYPAAALGLEHSLGRIAPGYRGDLVHFGEDFSVQSTWLAGERAMAL